MNIINKSGDHLLTMINEVLAMSKIESGKTRLNPQPFDLLKTLRDVTAMISVQTNEKNISFIKEYSDNLPRMISADEGKLRQILINILGNACKFTKEGAITLRVKTENQPSSDEIRIDFEVEDSGVGISEVEIGKIFDPFVQSTSGSQSSDGTGLGLPISKKYIQMMGGDVEVSSVPKSGTLIRFHILVKSVGEAAVLDIEPSRRVLKLLPGTGPWKILYVEDKIDNRLLLKSLLKSVGFKVLEAEDGKEGVRVFLEEEIDLIFMDIRMPKMDGYEAIAKIREIENERDEDSKHVPIIALTASVFEGTQEQLLSHGCDGYVRKPFREHEIFNIIKKYLDLDYLYDSAEDGAVKKERSISLAEARKKLLVLPTDLTAPLKEASAMLNFDLALELAVKIRDYDTILADTLTESIKNFRFDKISMLFDSEDPPN